MLNRLIAPALIFLFAAAATAGEPDPQDGVLGGWLTKDGEAVVEITRKDGALAGQIIWIAAPRYGPEEAEPGRPKRDLNNPDASQRDRPIIGLPILEGFQYDEDAERWEGGTIYDPNNGKTYNAMLWLEDAGTLKVRGYIGAFTVLGRTETWTRAPDDHEAFEQDEADAEDAGERQGERHDDEATDGD